MITFIQVAELFNIFVGLMLAAALLAFLGGLGGYFSQLGTWPSFRDRSIKTMEWGVAILFVLIVILGVVQYFERYPKIMSTVIASIVLIIVFSFIIRIIASPEKHEKKEE